MDIPTHRSVPRSDWVCPAQFGGWTRDAGMEGDRKKGRNEDEGVCGREKHYDGRRRIAAQTRAHAESQPARAHAGRAMLARADRKLMCYPCRTRGGRSQLFDATGNFVCRYPATVWGKLA
ncbi:hypothetical protein C8J57DRAFT_1257692 [Mycena rebaudengoi]|nr:hypothetical protein C8J57DRAFT_1257692 [Mycena rebaudengoi]